MLMATTYQSRRWWMSMCGMCIDTLNFVVPALFDWIGMTLVFVSHSHAFCFRYGVGAISKSGMD